MLFQSNTQFVLNLVSPLISELGFYFYCVIFKQARLFDGSRLRWLSKLNHSTVEASRRDRERERLKTIWCTYNKNATIGKAEFAKQP